MYNMVKSHYTSIPDTMQDSLLETIQERILNCKDIISLLQDLILRIVSIDDSLIVKEIISRKCSLWKPSMERVSQKKVTSAQHKTLGLHFLGTQISLKLLKVCFLYFVGTCAGLDVYYSPVPWTVFVYRQHIATTWLLMCHHNLVTFKEKFTVDIKAVIKT